MAFPKGLIVVIDPGHGGREEGALSPKGLKEKDINLEVALKLGSHLESEGVQVLLTRKEDRSLAHRERIRLAEEVHAHLYLSIHHNASPERPEELNRSEFYFPFQDRSPSSDLAWEFHRAFSREFGIPAHEPLPARYRVLQGDIPLSVLTEAFYLTFPGIEREIKGGILEKEARLLFDALLEFFRRGFPLIRSLRIRGTRVFSEIEDLSLHEITPLGIRLLFDGEPILFSFSKTKGISGRVPLQVSNGVHRISVQVENILGQRSRRMSIIHKVSRPPASFSLSPYPRGGKNPVMLILTLKDELGYPISKGEEVSLTLESGDILVSESVTDERGQVRAIVHFRESSKVFISARGFEGVAQVEVEKHRTLPYLVGRVIDSERGDGVLGVEIEAGGRRSHSLLGGYFFFEVEEEPPIELNLKKRGFVSLSVRFDEIGEIKEIPIEPLFEGALLEKRIFLDPEPLECPKGVEDSFLRRESHRVSHLLASFIEKAGGSATIVTEENGFIHPYERMKRAIGEGFDFYLVIEHKRDDFQLISFYEEDLKARIPTLFLGMLKEVFPEIGRKFGPSSDYRLVNLPGCRLKVTFPSREEKKEGEEVLEIAKRAYSLFVGLLRFFGYEEGVPFEIQLRDFKGNPLSGIGWTWKGFPGIVSSIEGKIRTLHIPPGEHEFLFFTRRGETSQRLKVRKGERKEVHIP